ncbi:hypothetical protein FA10DRAFT_262979 [Acaromyces ingoldii]|uniref:Uncharacterized protein n=1 Tax=Acaromyces ingoldii TaxID=215250 RepID=A0A316YHQ5_9BASI|nr:hypothetical protein FA10DRAFT_262979 [Acaromyces ingoldii]PWN87245.1 hypothetical protein FA10DRAFT_262979 [Acaromyces ingoldii]
MMPFLWGMWGNRMTYGSSTCYCSSTQPIPVPNQDLFVITERALFPMAMNTGGGAKQDCLNQASFPHWNDPPAPEPCGNQWSLPHWNDPSEAEPNENQRWLPRPNDPPESEPHDNQWSLPHPNDPPQAEILENQWLLPHWNDPPGYGPHSSFPQQAHVLDASQQHAAQHSEKHSRQDSSFDMPGYCEDESQSTVHDAPELQSQETSRRRPYFLTNDEWLQLSKADSDLLDMKVSELHNPELLSRRAKLIKKIREERKRSGIHLASIRLRSEKAMQKELKQRAQREKKIIINDLDGRRDIAY